MEFVKPEEKQIKIDGLGINYKQIGDGNIPIILLHGWGVSSDKYIETARQFMISASGGPAAGGQFSIIMPDLPGFGKSDNPPKAWGVGDYAEWLKNYAMAINLSSFVLTGHSFGGRVAIKFAAKYPEKLKTLILTGAAGIKHPPTLKTKLFFILAKIGKVIFSLPILNYLQNSAQKLLYKAAQEKDYYQTEGVMKETFKKIIDEDLAPCLEKISAHGGSASGGKTPTLLVWGAKDKSTPLEDGKLINKKINGSILKIIGSADHRLPYQYPQEFAKIVFEFIKNTNA